MTKICLGFLLLVTAISGFATDIALEQLMGVSVDDNGISFQLRSNGCTYRRDFDFNVVERLVKLGPHLPAYEYHYDISVRRLRPDNCELFVPNGTRLFMSFEELGIQFGKFHVTNPLGGEKIIGTPTTTR